LTELDYSEFYRILIEDKCQEGKDGPINDELSEEEEVRCTSVDRGGDLGRTGGRSPKNLRWGTAHALVPQYLEK